MINRGNSDNFYRTIVNVSLWTIIKCFLKKSTFLLFFIPFSSQAFQILDCDEVPITLHVKYLGQTELLSFICEKNTYFPIADLFDFLKVKNVSTHDFSGIEGFILNREDYFIIDTEKKQILYKGKTIPLKKEDFIQTRTTFYLDSKIIEEIFDLKSDFNPRTLSASLIPGFELASVRIARQEQMRENLKNTQHVFTADTTFLNEQKFFGFGTAAWNFNTMQSTNGNRINHLNLGVGGMVAGGDFRGNLNFNSNQKFSSRNLFYQWKYIDNDNIALRQTTVGKIAPQFISSIFNPMVGIQLTNAPTYINKSFGTYLLSDYTEPGWMVELYINNVMVDYLEADSSGFFFFNVPIMYGTTNVNLRFYGPWGEEELSERQVHIPFNFLSEGELQYNISSGLVENGNNDIFAQARANYGITNSINIGVGLEFLSSLSQDPIIPFLNTSLRLPANMLLSGEYYHNVGYKGNFNYLSPSQIRLELNYSKFKKEQEAVSFSYLEERKVTLSFPIKMGTNSATSRFTFRQNVLRNNTYTNMEWLLSGRAFGQRFNITSVAYYNNFIKPVITSSLSTSFRFYQNLIFSPMLEYDYNATQLTFISGELRTQIFKKINLRASYSHSFRFDQFNLNIGMSFNLDFSRVSINTSTSNDFSTFSQSGGGGLIFNPSEDYYKFTDKSVIGRGSILFKPFLDLNGNGKRDKDEHQIEGVNIHAVGGGIMEQLADGVTTITGLEPYLTYHFKVDDRGLNRIAWQIENKTMNVFVNPNQIKLIEIPVKVVGEVSGYIYESENGIGGIKINIFDSDKELITTVISEADGYFSYFGIHSGSYVARVDFRQLTSLNLKVNEESKFEIINTEEGHFLDNLEFYLQYPEEKN